MGTCFLLGRGLGGESGAGGGWREAARRPFGLLVEPALDVDASSSTLLAGRWSRRMILTLSVPVSALAVKAFSLCLRLTPPADTNIRIVHGNRLKIHFSANSHVKHVQLVCN